MLPHSGSAVCPKYLTSLNCVITRWYSFSNDRKQRSLPGVPTLLTLQMAGFLKPCLALGFQTECLRLEVWPASNASWPCKDFNETSESTAKHIKRFTLWVYCSCNPLARALCPGRGRGVKCTLQPQQTWWHQGCSWKLHPVCQAVSTDSLGSSAADQMLQRQTEGRAGAISPMAPGSVRRALVPTLGWQVTAPKLPGPSKRI